MMGTAAVDGTRMRYVRRCSAAAGAAVAGIDHAGRRIRIKEDVPIRRQIHAALAFVIGSRHLLGHVLDLLFHDCQGDQG